MRKKNQEVKDDDEDEEEGEEVQFLCNSTLQ